MKPTILLIEDDESISAMYASKFKHDHFEVTVAKDGQTGLTQALQSKPAIIVLDIMMPNMNGVEFINKLRQYKEMADVHLIVLTNMDNPATSLEIKNLGIEDFYIKAEVTPQDISDRIKTLLKIV